MLHLRSIQVLRRLDALQVPWIAETAWVCRGQCLLMSVEQLDPRRQGRSGPSHWAYKVDHRLGSMPSIVFLSSHGFARYERHNIGWSAVHSFGQVTMVNRDHEGIIPYWGIFV